MLWYQIPSYSIIFLYFGCTVDGIPSINQPIVEGQLRWRPGLSLPSQTLEAARSAEARIWSCSLSRANTSETVRTACRTKTAPYCFSSAWAEEGGANMVQQHPPTGSIKQVVCSQTTRFVSWHNCRLFRGQPLVIGLTCFVKNKCSFMFLEAIAFPAHQGPRYQGCNQLQRGGQIGQCMAFQVQHLERLGEPKLRMDHFGLERPTVSPTWARSFDVQEATASAWPHALISWSFTDRSQTKDSRERASLGRGCWKEVNLPPIHPFTCTPAVCRLVRLAGGLPIKPTRNHTDTRSYEGFST